METSSRQPADTVAPGRIQTCGFPHDGILFAEGDGAVRAFPDVPDDVLEDLVPLRSGEAVLPPCGPLPVRGRRRGTHDGAVNSPKP